MNIFALTILPVLLLTGLAVVMLGVRVFFVKGGKFPSSHVGDNPALREKGIKCHREN